jgi:FixJ family two-component response regulator
VIAVVDDDEPVRKAVVRLLRSAGFSSRGFASGQELLEAWLSEPPDCLVLDLQLPGRSGLEVQRELRLAGTRVPTIIMTASDEPCIRDECVGEGASACLRKPLDEEALLRVLERLRVHPDRPA